MDSNILDSYSQEDKYSINNSMVGVYKEEKKEEKSQDNSKDISFFSKSKIYEDKDNEEEEEISDIEKNSDIEDDCDYSDLLSSISKEKNISTYNKSYFSRDNEDDQYVKRKKENEDLSLNYFSFLDSKEPMINIDIEEGFTQMVNKNIKKSIKLPYYENNEMIEVLMIAEKPSLARTISYFLKGKNFTKHDEDRIAIFTFEGKFQGKKAFFTVSSIRGHIYQDSFKYQENEESYFDVGQYDEKIVKILKKEGR